MPRCVFGDGLYRCPELGIGDPPLCRHHFELIRDGEVEDEEPVDDPDLLMDIVDRFLSHPYIRGRIDQVVDAIGDTARFKPAYRGPGQAYEAECPPRPRQDQRKRRSPPPREPPLAMEDPRQILHFSPTQALTPEIVRKRQRQLARLAHPDVGGTEDAMRRINEAAERLISQLR